MAKDLPRVHLGHPLVPPIRLYDTYGLKILGIGIFSMFRYRATVTETNLEPCSTTLSDGEIIIGEIYTIINCCLHDDVWVVHLWTTGH